MTRYTKIPFASLIIISLWWILARCTTQDAEIESIPGLNGDVEIMIDNWGVSHIYADSEQDLFFAQGYNAARDRLFQFEIWRRQATGTVAEMLGPEELRRDIGTRLFMFRGDMEIEMNHYHPKGSMIIESFTKGVNAYMSFYSP